MNWKGGLPIYTSALIIGAEMICVLPLEAYGRASHVLGVIKTDTSAVCAQGQALFYAPKPSQCLSGAELFISPILQIGKWRNTF